MGPTGVSGDFVTCHSVAVDQIEQTKEPSCPETTSLALKCDFSVNDATNVGKAISMKDMKIKSKGQFWSPNPKACFD